MTDRSDRTRQQLIDAGVQVLTEGGWAALTSRAVARRSEVNVGLIHYHFGGMPGLRAAIAQGATRDPDIAVSMRDGLRDARRHIAERLSTTASASIDDAATATLLIAATDGLLLHLLIDPHLDIDPPIRQLRRLLDGADPR